MDYKEKYEQALAKAKDLLNYKEVRQEDMEYLFPELKESEDERIRKALLDYHKNAPEQYTCGGLTNAEVVAWLEKQKPVEWSSKDLTILEDTIFFINEYQKSDRCQDEGDMQNSVTCENWLKSFRLQKKEAQPQWRRLPLSGISYAPDSWCVMDVTTSTVGANSASVSALVKGDKYVPLFELEKFIRNI